MNFKKMISIMMILVMMFLVACSSGTTPEAPKTPEAPTAEQPVVEPVKKDGGILVFPIGSDPKVLNPLYAGDRVTMTMNNALFAPLFVTDTAETQYYLAESITSSEDFLSYTLKLKSGLKWHDGQPITADDVVFTIESLLNPEQNSHLRDGFLINGEPIKVEKTDDLTVVFTLPEVYIPFLSSLEEISPIPKHVFEGEANLAQSTKNAAPIGSGPFKFKSSKSGELFELERFDDYFDGKANLDGIAYRVIADANSANIALQNGELSARYLTPSEVKTFENSESIDVITYDEGMLVNMVFNLNNEILKNKEVRKAIAYAINKEEVIIGAYLSEDYADAASSVLVPSTKYYTDEVEKYDHDVEKAKELLGKSGATSLKLKLAYINGTKTQESQALVMQNNLKDIGIDVEILAMERGAFYEKLLDPTNKDFDLAFNGYVMGSEPNLYKALFATGNMNNFMKYENAELDKKWNAGAIETDETKRSEIYKEIQVELLDDMVLYPIAYPKSIVAISKSVGGIEEATPVPIFMFRDLSKLYLVE